MAEVFGFPPEDTSLAAVAARSMKRCPFLGAPCHKKSAVDPLGVCSVWSGEEIVATCPDRLRQDGLIEPEVARVALASSGTRMLSEVPLRASNGLDVGNIDFVVQSTADPDDFAAVELQAVYISGNIQKAFDWFMANPQNAIEKGWPKKSWPHPDYRSSSKRLTTQLVSKGHIVSKAWKRKQVVVVDAPYFDAMPRVPEVAPERANLIWLVVRVAASAVGQHRLVVERTVYSDLDEAIIAILTPDPGPVSDFLKLLDDKALAEQRRRTRAQVTVPYASDGGAPRSHSSA
jgi:hypothetical protein